MMVYRLERVSSDVFETTVRSSIGGMQQVLLLIAYNDEQNRAGSRGFVQFKQPIMPIEDRLFIEDE